MVKNSFILGLFLSMGMACHAQFGPQQVITTDAALAKMVFAADIDGDGAIDVLSASSSDDKIAWYKNTDGKGSFGTQNVIGLLDNVGSVHAADLDGDTDMDIMGTSGSDDLVVWYENLDGQGSFGSQQIIANNANGAFFVIAADIDGDDDMDVISASDLDNKIAWYENDGTGNFSVEQIIATSANNGRSIFASDIDGDDDLDIVASSSGSEILTWFENLNGLGSFGPPQIIAPTALATVSVFAIDLDGDDDMDVLSAAPANDRVSWYENLDEQGNFGPENIITNLADGANTVFSADLDNDLDNDVLSASAVDGKIAWYENDGLGNFSTQQIITTDAPGTLSVFAADLDNDTDIDVLSASQIDNKIAWYENLTILDVPAINASKAIIYPNPVHDTLYVDIPNEDITQIELYNLSGKKVQSNLNNTNQIKVTNLAAGAYLLKIYTETGVIVKKIVKK